MLLLSRRFQAFRARDERSSTAADPSGTSHRTFTPRTRVALALGFMVAAAGVLLVGPYAGTGFAEADDNMSFWQAERMRTVATKQQQAPGPADQRQQVRRQQVSHNALAYAQPQQHPQPQSGSALGALLSVFDRRGAPSVKPAQSPAPRRQAVAGKRPPEPAQLVCVRLCDGYHFPAPAGMTANDAGCAAACPRAPTRLYRMRNDSIGDAVSKTDGAPYSRLPVALFYTKSRDETCTCGRPDAAATIMLDRSLRRGDRYMSENGFLIYQGAAGSKFKPLAHSRGVPRAERRLLAAMERVSLPQRSQQAVVTTPPAGNLVMLRSSLAPKASTIR